MKRIQQQPEFILAQGEEMADENIIVADLVEIIMYSLSVKQLPHTSKYCEKLEDPHEK